MQYVLKLQEVQERKKFEFVELVGPWWWVFGGFGWGLCWFFGWFFGGFWRFLEVFSGLLGVFEIAFHGFGIF